MTNTIVVTDVSGNPLEVGTRVAYNYSGEIRLGIIEKVVYNKAKEKRDTDIWKAAQKRMQSMRESLGLPEAEPMKRKVDKLSYYSFVVRPIVGKGKSSKISKRQNLHSIENI